VLSCLNGKQIHARSSQESLGGSKVDSIVHERYHRYSFGIQEDFTYKKEYIKYVHSDYTGDLDKGQSTTGYVFTLS